MWSLYLLPAFRHFQQNPGFVTINLIGLSFGLAGCLLVFSFVANETSYDAFLPGVDQLYRIEGTYNYPGREPVPVGTYFGPLKELLPQDYPEVEEVTRLDDRPGFVKRGDDYFGETLMYADPNFFQMIQFPLLEGNPETAIPDVTGAAISRDMAVKYLGDGPWLGRTITINDGFEREHVVSAVFENIPDNSHFDLDILLPLDERVYGGGDGQPTPLTTWGYLPYMVYFKLKEGATTAHLEDTINDFVDRYVPSSVTDAVGQSGSETYIPKILPLQTIHLESIGQYQMKPPGSWSLVYGFSAIGALILIVACINYMNLATAQATKRAKEVAMRRVNGAGRRQLSLQHQLEAVMLVFAGAIIGLALAATALPIFQTYSERQIHLLLPRNLAEVGGVIAFLVGIGMLAGFYPAVVLSRVRPARALSSISAASSAHSRLRSSLVVFQFAVSAGLIISTALIYIQTRYAETVDLGFDRDNKISLVGLSRVETDEARETFKQRVMNLPGVTGAALASFTPGDRDRSAIRAMVPNSPNPILIFFRSIDWDFMDLYGVKPVAGRLFDRDHGTDRVLPPETAPTVDDPQHVNIVVNMSTIRMLGFATPEEAIGQILRTPEGSTAVYTVVGVIPDVHFKTLRRPLIPEVYVFSPDRMDTLSVAVGRSDVEALGQQIDRIWREMFPRIPATRIYVDEYMIEQFRVEEVQGILLGIFSGFAILIACVGLFGLSAFAAERRTREIGIRKVLGAGRADIFRLMLRQFSLPILIANAIAWPLSWLAMSDWITSFHYRIDLPPNFALAAALGIAATIIFGWMTVGSHAFRVSRANPVHALRYE